jgi:tripartite-type tricarboxylate transporter receptor subunit TctC
MKRRTVIQGGLCAGLSLIGATRLISGSQAQEKWPSRSVTIVVPLAAGGNTDSSARLIAEKLKDVYGQPFIIENRPGASGTIGANTVAKARADGYTLLMAGNSGLSAAPALLKSVPYDPVKDFVPIARVGRFSSVLVTTPDRPFKSMAELVAHAKANPGKLTIAYSFSSGQIVAESLKKRTGIDLTTVPYTRTPDALLDLIGGRIDLAVTDMLSGVPQIEAGKIVPLATFFLDRSSLLPNVPTLNETVMPGFEELPWLGLFGPAGLPGNVVKTISDNLRTILGRPEIVAHLGKMGVEPYYASSEETVAFVTADLPKWQKLAREAGIEPI